MGFRLAPKSMTLDDLEGVTCQSPLLKAPPTKSPLKSGRRAMGRKFKSPPRQAPPKKLRRLINRRLETTPY